MTKSMNSSELENCINEYMQGKESYFHFSIGTEQIICDKLESFDCSFINQLLDIRIFNEKCEFRAVRSDLSKDFKTRLVIDDTEKLDYFNHFDENQYLDIDASKSSGNSYISTGGGEYTLPIENAEKIKLRNYIEYNDDGEAQVKDFRIVKLLAKGEK